MAVSAEPCRKKAYSVDLRDSTLENRLPENRHQPTFHSVKNFNVAVSTAYRTYRIFARTGKVDPLDRSSGREELRKLDRSSELYVVGFILDNPSIYLHEVCQEVKECFDLTIAPSTICKLLKRYGITRKKIRQVARQRCNALRGAFMAQTFLFNREMFVWVDETGTDKRDQLRKYGYALRGTTPVYHRFLSRGDRINAIAAITSSGLLTVELTKATVNGDNFFDFIRGTLIPHMRPFDGVSPHSILIMDNCSVHHVNEVREVLQQAGILVLFLPPYSPDLNPLEEAFSYIKQYLCKHDELLQAIRDPTDVIMQAFQSITAKHCNSWISHAQYPL